MRWGGRRIARCVPHQLGEPSHPCDGSASMVGEAAHILTRGGKGAPVPSISSDPGGLPAGTRGLGCKVLGRTMLQPNTCRQLLDGDAQQC